MAPEPAELEARMAAEAPALRDWLRRACGPEGEDVAQEALLRALRRRCFDALSGKVVVEIQPSRSVRSPEVSYRFVRTQIVAESSQ